MTYALQNQITRKHFKKKENKPSPKFIQNKDRYHTKKFPRNAANQRKIPSFKSDDGPQYLSLLLLKRPKECPIIKCYSNRCAQNAECRLHTGGVGLSFLDSTRPTNISALMMRIKRKFPGATSVISRPATCKSQLQVSIFCSKTGETLYGYFRRNRRRDDRY